MANLPDASQFPGINQTPNTAPTQEMKDAATQAGFNYVDTPTGWTLSNTVNGQQNFSGITSTANDAGGLVYQYTGQPAIADSAQHTNDLANLQALGADVGNISYDRNAQLASSAKAEAQAKFAPLIRQATEQKRQGMATSIVRAGQRGGFENTQLAGIAAFTPTVGADFVGTGGQLEATKSAYDLNISNLQAQQVQYEAASLSALQQAEKDGNQQHFDNALKLYQIAQQKVKDVADLQNAKDQHLATLQNIQSQQTMMEKNQQEVVQNNLDTFASGSLIIGEDGSINLPDIAMIKANATTLGVTPQQLTASLRKQQADLSKMSAEDRKRELEIKSLQRQQIPQMFQEFDEAVKRNMWNPTTDGGIMDFIASKKSAEDTKNTPLSETGLDRDTLVLRLGKQVFGKNISDKEREFLSSAVDKGLKQGISESDLIDNFLGYNIDKGDKKLAQNLKEVLLQNTTEGLNNFDMSGLARLLNEGKNAEAIRKTESMALENARKNDPTGFVSESNVKSQVQKANDIKVFINGLVDKNGNSISPVGVASGTWQDWIGRFKNKEAQDIAGKVTGLVAQMRNDLSGTAVTETERKFLEPLIPSLTDTPDNFLIKLNNLNQNALTGLNSFRDTNALPKLDSNTLLNPEKKVDLYSKSYKDYQDFLQRGSPTEKSDMKSFIEKNQDIPPADIWDWYNGGSFNNVGGDTNSATSTLEKVVSKVDGTKGGQCGHFVNQITKIGVGDSYTSKLAKMDASIKAPRPGMVFTMPTNGDLSEYGHVGIILSIKDGVATVKDSNWHGDEKVLTHTIPVSKMTGFTYPKV